jgi:hypothetical protein
MTLAQALLYVRGKSFLLSTSDGGRIGIRGGSGRITNLRWADYRREEGIRIWLDVDCVDIKYLIPPPSADGIWKASNRDDTPKEPFTVDVQFLWE